MKEIEATIATMARIPPKTVSKSDTELLRNLESDLKRVVFGQDQAIHALSAAIKLARAGLRDAEKPIGCYLFSGPTGVGKTEVARQLASLLGVELLRFDMSEYMERHTVSRLIGAPPGYVGFDQGGLLTDGVDQNPHCVLLLDEIEKAHPDLFNILLQVMDHGKLTDHNGKQVDFRNVILIMTTNAGAAEMAKAAIGFGSTQRARARTRRRSSACSRPSSATGSTRSSRSRRLSREMISQVVEKFIFQLEAQLADRNVMIELSPEAMEWIADHGYDELYRRPAASPRHPGAHQEAAGRGAAVRQARRRRNGSRCRGRAGRRKGALVRDHRDQAAGQGRGHDGGGWRWRRPHAHGAYPESAAEPVNVLRTGLVIKLA